MTRTPEFRKWAEEADYQTAKRRQRIISMRPTIIRIIELLESLEKASDDLYMPDRSMDRFAEIACRMQKRAWKSLGEIERELLPSPGGANDN